MFNRKSVRGLTLLLSMAMLAIGCTAEGAQVKAEGVCAGGTLAKDRTHLVGQWDLPMNLYVSQRYWLPPLPDTIGFGSSKKLIYYERMPAYSEWFVDDRLQPGEWYEPDVRSNGILKIQWGQDNGLASKPEGELVLPMILTEDIEVCVVRDAQTKNHMDSYYIRESKTGKER